MTEAPTVLEIRESGKWKPPKKELGGVDLVEYFSGLFLSESIELLYRDLAMANKDTDIPLFKEYKERIPSFLEKIRKELEEKNLYFYELEGKISWSVFLDYKTMRKEACRKLGSKVEMPLRPLEPDPDAAKGFNLMKSKFNPNMTLEEVLRIARDFVSTWEWGD